MIDFVSTYGKNFYSQNGEDGIIDEVLKRMRRGWGVCVEFGAADGYYCSNTRTLIDRKWLGHLFDVNPSGDVEKATITPENVNDLIPKCDLLSIDIDGNDYNVWKAYQHKPSIVIIEINSSVGPDEDYPVSDMEHGTAFKPMVELGGEKGYFLLCHTGNLIFIDKEYKILFPDVEQDVQKLFNKKWLNAA